VIAVCGLDCSECNIYKAAADAALAQKIADALSRGDSEVTADQIQCAGCRGDRAQHWSADCKILVCCTDEKQLDSCHKCGDFPCPKLEEWAQGSEHYGEALQRLKNMKA